MKWKKVNVMVVAADYMILRQCVRILESYSDVTVVETAVNGEEAYEKIRRKKPDLVISEIIMPGMDGFTMIELLQENWLGQIPDFVLCYCAVPEMLAGKERMEKILNYLIFPVKDKILERQLRASIDFHIKKRFTYKKEQARIAMALAEEGNYEKKEEKPQDRMEKLIAYELRQFGAVPYYKGYQYLLQAIYQITQLQKGEEIPVMHLYPLIAEQMNVSSCAVERAMRTSISKIWEEGNREYLKAFWKVHYIGPHNRPTNGNFVQYVADQIRLEYGQEQR